VCGKEKELGEMHEDLALIRRDVKYIRKTIEGNGRVGLIDDVEQNKEFRLKSEAGLGIVKFLIVIGGGSLVANLVNMYMVYVH